MKSNRMRAVGIHVFAGLFTTGIRAHFDVTGVLESGTFGVATARRNFPDIPIHVGESNWPLDELAANPPDLMYGNPACARFSCLNPTRSLHNEANAGLQQAHEVALRVRPRAFVVESVVPLFSLGLPLIEKWESEWQAAGYNTCRLVESAIHLGLPQNRKRALFIAAQANLDFSYYLEREPTTVRDAIGDLPSYVPPAAPKSYYDTYSEWMKHFDARCSSRLTQHESVPVSKRLATLLPHLKQNQRFENIPDEIYEKTYWEGRPKDKRGKPGLMYRRLSWDRPCSVLPGAPCVFHPDEDRFLTVREQARCMGVPDWFEFSSIPKAYAEIGKAVSPIVGYWIGDQLVDILAYPKGREHRKSVNLITDEKT